MKFYLMVSADCEPTSASRASAINRHVDRVEATDWRDRQMHAQRKGRRGDLIPVILAAFVAVVGQTVILFDDFGLGNDWQGRGSATMITAAVVSGAGAIEIPSEPPAGRPVSRMR